MSLPDFRLPAIVARIGGRLVQWPHGAALATALNGALLGGWLKAEQLADFEGKVFAVEVEDAGITARFTWRAGRFRPAGRRDGTPDLRFRAQLATYLKLLAREEDPDTLFFQRALMVEGDTELGLAVKNMLDAVEWPAWPGRRAA